MFEIKKNFGFGLMRLPMIGEDIDFDQVNKMVDLFMERGFTYFDTAHGYLNGLSEVAFKKCVSERYDRESYTITDKLSPNFFNSSEDIYKIIDVELEACGVEYFDLLLMHAQSRNNYDHYKKHRAYEIAEELKASGKIRHMGISFHDTAEFLDKILTENPNIEVVQLQINYLDYLDYRVQSKLCIEVCHKHNKPIIVMEPVKGGALVNLNDECKSYFNALDSNKSMASYAIRFAASIKDVVMVLSGMSTLGQMEDNVSFMDEFIPLNDSEYQAIDKVTTILRSQQTIQCTSCRYCTEVCPKNIDIPNLFADLNQMILGNKDEAINGYNVHTLNNDKASMCLKCGKCEGACPQHLEIRKLLERVDRAFN